MLVNSGREGRVRFGQVERGWDEGELSEQRLGGKDMQCDIRKLKIH